MLIMDAQAHMIFELLLRVGMLPVRIVGAPGNQGAGVTGTHGTGVGTPSLAAVAAIKVGFAGQLHIPNGGMLAIGAELMMFAKGMSTKTPDVGSTFKVEGARPNGQVNTADVEIPRAIINSFFASRLF